MGATLPYAAITPLPQLTETCSVLKAPSRILSAHNVYVVDSAIGPKLPSALRLDASCTEGEQDAEWHPIPVIKTVYLQSRIHECGRMILDNGCQRNVAGSKWHKEFRAALSKLGLQGIKLKTNE